MIPIASLIAGVVMLVASPVVTSTMRQIIAYSTNSPAAAAAAVSSPFVYNFNSPGLLDESGSMDTSSSPYWWLNSGGELWIEGGQGKTIQGDLPVTNKWRTAYAVDNPTDTDIGVHPQNIFRLVTRSKWQNLRQEVYFMIIKDQLSASSNRNASNGALLFNRYVSGQTLYYTGVRVDGAAVIKKKLNGTYYTMDYKPFVSGTYNSSSNPNLLPKNTWIGLRSEVTTDANGVVTIKLYTDNGKTGNWVLSAQATDNGSTYGPAITDKAYAGIRTDFADFIFSNYKIEEISLTSSGSTSGTGTSTATSTGSTTSSSGGSSSGSSGSGTTTTPDTTSPVITVVGNNPARVAKGTTYVDLGATVTDDVSTNIGIQVTGSVDTTKLGTYTLSYRAVDNAGNVGTSTRSVIVFDPNVQSTSSSTTNCSGITVLANFYIDTQMQAARYERDTRNAGDTASADFLKEIACQPQAIWVTGGTPQGAATRVGTAVTDAQTKTKIPLIVLYNIPQYNSLTLASGMTDGAAYHTWITEIAKAVGTKQAWIIMEPDAVAISFSYTTADRATRLATLRDAITTLRSLAPNARIYLDGGHSAWRDIPTIASYLKSAGLDLADGFSTNVSNFRLTSSEVVYAKSLSAATGGKKAIIDIGRNGNGPTSTAEWCNPSGRALGGKPTQTTGEAVVDAFVWIKNPGESDGTCNGGPTPGKFWLSYAVGLVQNYKTNLINSGSSGSTGSGSSGTSTASSTSSGSGSTSTSTSTSTSSGSSTTEATSSPKATTTSQTSGGGSSASSSAASSGSSSTSDGTTTGSSSSASSSGGGGGGGQSSSENTTSTNTHTSQGGGGGGGGGGGMSSTIGNGNSTSETRVETTSSGSQTQDHPTYSKSPITRFMWLGVRSEEVRAVQKMLASEGLYEGELTDFYGPRTRKAIEAFQQKYDVVSGGSPDTTGFGIVGSKTLSKLNEVYVEKAIGPADNRNKGSNATSTGTTVTPTTAPADKQELITRIKNQIEALIAQVNILLEQVKALKAVVFYSHPR